MLTSLDKLDRGVPADVIEELAGRGLDPALAGSLVGMLTAPDAADRLRAALKPSEEGPAGLDEVDEVLRLAGAQLPPGRVDFRPRAGPRAQLLHRPDLGAGRARRRRLDRQRRPV